MSNKSNSKSHDAFALLLDVGSTSSQHLCNEGGSDLDSSVQLLDWVISRKIFTESNDRFSLIFFGHDTSQNDFLPQYSNIYVYNNEYETAKIDWLKIFEKEITSNLKCAGNYCAALITGLESLKVHQESVDPKHLNLMTITLISNFAGIDDSDELIELIQPIVSAFHTLGAQLMVIGPDLSSVPKSSSQAIGFNFIKTILSEVNGCSFSFKDGFSQLNFFVPKQAQPRGQPFTLDLAKDFSIKMQMYLKNTEASMKFSFNPVTSGLSNKQVIELKKIRQYETMGESNEGIHVDLADIDQISDEKFKTGKFSSDLPTAKVVNKDDIIKGYRYGQSLIPVGAIEQTLLEYPKEGKQLQLLQFTKMENILPQFILSNARYFLPQSKDDVALQSMSALVNSMLELGVVALCRYAYNINSNPRVACLFPKISKKFNTPMLIHYTIPFNEDLRNYEFPPLTEIGAEPTDYQLDIMDEYITSMMLCEPDGSNESMRCKDILNPKHQYQCQLLRQKAMHPSEPFPEIQRKKLLEGLSPPIAALNRAKEIIESMQDAFPLELNQYTRHAIFKTRSDNNAQNCPSKSSIGEMNTEKADVKNFST